MRAKGGGVEYDSKVWGSGECERRVGEWRMRAKFGGVENESEVWGSGE